MVDGGTTELKCDRIFIAMDYEPNTKMFKEKLDMDEKGYIIVREGTKTSVEGVFTAGDIQDTRYQQAITAAASGCMATIDAERFLESSE